MPNKIVASTAMWFLLTGSGAVAATTSCNTVAACVLGTNMSTGYGVEGTSKGNDGVFGMTTQNATSASSGRAGVAGIDSSTNKDGFNSGVYGTSLYGYGVQGKSTSGFGVVGVTMQNPAATADEKAGVAGYDRSTSGFNSGVYGTSPGGYGVQGSSSAVGVYGVSDVYVGVQALSTNPYDGEGLLAVSDGSHAETILAVAQGGGDLFEGGDYERVTALINVRGDMTLAGSLTANSTPNFSATDSTGSQVVTYGDRSTSATLNDMGEASW